MIYLDNAATTRYLPPEVLKAFIEECNRKSNPGRGGHNDSINSALKIQKVREIVCNYSESAFSVAHPSTNAATTASQFASV